MKSVQTRIYFWSVFYCIQSECYPWTSYPCLLREYGSIIIRLIWMTNDKPYYITVPFLYPLKTSENQIFFDVFKGYRKRQFTWNVLKTCNQFVSHFSEVFLLEQKLGFLFKPSGNERYFKLKWKKWTSTLLWKGWWRMTKKYF